LPAPPGNYAAVAVLAGGTGAAVALNNAGQVVGISNGSVFLWTPATPNGNIGSLLDLGVAASNISRIAINDSGQVAGTSVLIAGSTQAFLWSPATPNGTTGVAAAFLGTNVYDPSTATAINTSGQIAGALAGTPFLWTASAPNGVAGSLNSDPRLRGAGGIIGLNDFGQAILDHQPTLFTPSLANGSTGSFTSIPGLPLSSYDVAFAINKNGVVLGESCLPAPQTSDCNHGFLWTPSIPNGATGTTAEIPLPPGFIAMYPTALNARGDVVGTMFGPGTTISFLYSGGTIYDLSALGNFSGTFGTPAAINDGGQILFNNGVLATPGTAPPTPAAGAVAITIAPAFSWPGPGPTSSPQIVYASPLRVTGTGCSPGVYNLPSILQWTSGATCTVTLLSQSMQLGARAQFLNWVDGATANPRVITAPSAPAVYTALFTAQYFVTAKANPSQGGTVTGGGWYTAGSTATLTASPAAGYLLMDPPTKSVNVIQAQTIYFNFEPFWEQPPGYQVSVILSDPTGGFGASAINYSGQVAGFSYLLSGEPFLWTPFSPNSPFGSIAGFAGPPTGRSFAAGINNAGEIVGVTSREDAFGDIDWSQPFIWINGTIRPVLEPTPGPTTIGINNYGQIAGVQYTTPYARTGTGFLWTPSSPNAATGTVNTDPRFQGLVGINDFGEAIMNAQPPVLFTPLAPHLATGSFTALTGLPGTNPQLVAINSGGAIVGVSSGQTFLWTPTAPNGSSGTTAVIPPPPGFVSMTPVAMNASGQVLGTMIRADGAEVPFLYSVGLVHDLSSLSNQFSGPYAIPIAINDRGQILINVLFQTTSYLLTPGAPALPFPAFANPDIQTPYSPPVLVERPQPVVYTFYDPRGWQDLGVLDILINRTLDPRNACYLAYSVPSSTLYLVNDAGQAAGPFAGAAKLGSSSFIQNSQCFVSLVSAAGSGNTLTLTLEELFNPSFAGYVYVAARDLEQNSSGWVLMGTAGQPASTFAITPATGVGPGPIAFTITYTPPDGSPSLGIEDILISDVTLHPNAACFLAYTPSNHALSLVSQDGRTTLPGMSLAAPGSLSNSQCTVTWGTNPVTSADGALTLVLSIGFNPDFGPNLIFWLAARDANGAPIAGYWPVSSWAVQ